MESSSRLQSLLKRLHHLSITGLSPLARFLELPVELQLRIWPFAGSEPRKVKLVIFGMKLDPVYTGRNWWLPKPNNCPVEGQATIPLVLRVCSRSRHEGLSSYTLCEIYVDLTSSRTRSVYVNFGVDSFQINQFHRDIVRSCGEFRTTFSLADMNRTQIIDIDSADQHRHGCLDIFDVGHPFGGLPNVKQANLLLKQQSRKNGQGYEYISYCLDESEQKRRKKELEVLASEIKTKSADREGIKVIYEVVDLELN